MPQNHTFRDYLSFLLIRQRGRRATFLRYTIYVYLGTLFAFGGLYYALFRRNPTTFAFTADILSAQATTFRLAARRDSVTADQQIILLQALADSVSARPGLPITRRPRAGGFEAVVSLGGREYSVAGSVADSASGAVRTPGTLEVRQQGYGLLAELELPAGALDVTPATAGELQQQARGLIEVLREQRSRSRELIRRLPTGARPNWGYVDFVYFSAITQLTVGYGDILPNTTLVRVLVVIHSLVAVVMLVVVINLVITGGAPEPGEPAGP